MENGNGVEERENSEDLVPGALPICGPTTRLDEESPSTMNKDVLKNSNSVIKTKGAQNCFTEENGVVRETSDEKSTQNEDKIPTGLRQGVNSGYPTEETGKIGTYNFSSYAAIFAPQNTMTEYQKSVWPRLKNEDPQHIPGIGLFIHYLAKLRALIPINGSKSVSTGNGTQSPHPQIHVPEQEPLPQNSKEKSGDDDTIDVQSPRKRLKLSQGPSTATSRSVAGFGPSLVERVTMGKWKSPVSPALLNVDVPHSLPIPPVKTNYLKAGMISKYSKAEDQSRKKKNYLITHGCFLFRNYEKIRRMREVEEKFRHRFEKRMTSWVLRFKAGDGLKKNEESVLEDEKFESLLKISQILYELYWNLIGGKDENGKSLCDFFMEPPSKTKFPNFHTIYDQWDYRLKGLKSLEEKIIRGHYKSLHSLEIDIGTILLSFSRAYETERPHIHSIVSKIKNLYNQEKERALIALIQSSAQMASLASFTTPLPRFTTELPGFTTKDVIRCICGTYSDEEKMILCEKCKVCQHCHCMRVPSSLSKVKVTSQENVEMDTQILDDATTTPYYCEKCEARDVNLEIPLAEADVMDVTPGGDKSYYLTLLREDGFLVRKNDTVYVLKELRIGPHGMERPGSTYNTTGEVVSMECDIFRIQELFRDQNGNGYAYGYNYLRPSETFHERNHRFYKNEVFRTLIVEEISIDLIHGICWVLDSATFSKGRPKGCVEDDLYICDFRVDNAGRVLPKVMENSQTICTKPYAFDHFETKLMIQRNLHPHAPPSPEFKLNSAGKLKRLKTDEKTKYKNLPSTQKLEQMTKQRFEQRERLNRVLDTLSSRIEDFNSDVVDLSHLLSTTGP